MANESAKKIVRQNTRYLRNARYFVFGFMALHVLGLAYFNSNVANYLGMLVFLLINVKAYLFLKLSAKPTTDPSGFITNPGIDLNQKGIIEFVWDLLYVTWFAEIATIVSNYFWFILLIIPIYAIYKLVSLSSAFNVSPAPSENKKEKFSRSSERRRRS